ncbi:hypothetical protein ASF69_01650 [Rhizobium sp. Leaf311]|uniref:hypothetical protein n=1 Tax=Rhizobium sp. Leaf311 TaxID=1736332 RepID=UPI0007126A26|nr:hypothetical protein [Rhizobium sp. Leaf311]KQQ61154.1 hypothetical protein ASF69_01650 [Rhizobium sp. Leaf311]
MNDDPFFNLRDADSDWNAFIGRQGNFANYADGYIEAALDLANLIIEKRLYSQRDTLVLPILYNARHSIELHLKLIIGELVKVGILDSGHVPNHDIASHLKHLIDRKIPDATLRSLLNVLQPFVESLTKVDDDGQELRYYTNRDGKRSMQDRVLVNIVVMRDSLEVLKETLEDLKYRTAALCDAHRTGTHTNHLSRTDLFVIAGMLPKRTEWSEPKFDVCKTAVKHQFEIGNRQFTIALETIQKKRELNSMLGVETPLVHLSDEKAIFLSEKWRELHPPRDNDGTGLDYFARDFDAMKDRRQKESSIMEDILATMTSDEIADAETIFYLSRNRDYSESYEEFLGGKKKEYRHSDLKRELSHIMEKTNFLREFTTGVRILGRLSLAETLKAI